MQEIQIPKWLLVLIILGITAFCYSFSSRLFDLNLPFNKETKYISRGILIVYLIYTLILRNNKKLAK